ncbi:hypothetical protein [uncultured Deinococcus sp.]|uniref:hypothetical protein n=1 Tax=uncultured Deinococcus sp. TaxID=158789 RepID=UPI00258AC750|nr:hypothetical protein [uncultured Deinococcus sp.]
MKKSLLSLPVLLLTGLLAACDSTQPPNNGGGGGGETGLPGSSPISATRIAGKINGNTLKLGRVVLDTRPSPSFGTAQVDATNSISLDLTSLTPPDSEFFSLSKGCLATGGAQLPDIRVYADGELDSYGPQSDFLGTVTERIDAGTGRSSEKSQVVRFYSPSDASFRATCTFQSGSDKFVEDFDITLKAGWNAVAFTPNGQTYSFRNTGSDTQTSLQFQGAQPRAVIFLDPETLTFDSAATVTVDATVIQVGGYSGSVSLKTDDLNLTVEPSTLNLPALSAQSISGSPVVRHAGVSQQRVQQKLTFSYKGSGNVNRSFNLQVLGTNGQQVGSGQGQLVVRRPGIDFTTGSEGFQTRIEPDSKVSFNVSLISVGNFSGPVTLRIENLPAGITAQPKTVSLNTYASTYLDLVSDASLVPGTYTATVVAEGGDRSARLPLQITVPKPSVSLSVDRSPVIYQGATGSVEVRLRSNAGFSGQTTLSLSNLPSGVTSPPTAVTVTPGTTTTVQLPITASVGATLGTSTVTVTSPDALVQNDVTTTTQLTVRPSRQALSVNVSELTRAGQSLWVADSSRYNSTTGRYQTVLTRLSDTGQVLTSATVQTRGGVSTQLVGLASGDILYINRESGQESYRVSEQGTVTPLSTNFTSNDTLSTQADAQGRVWFIQRVSTGTGGYTTSLAYWDPTSNTVTKVDSSRNYGTSYSAGKFAVSPDGKTLIFSLSSYDSTKPVRIDAATATLTDLSLSGSIQSLVVSNQGTVWYSDYGPLKRLNADGSVTSFDGVSVDKLTGFDTQNSAILWGTSYNGVIKIDSTAGKATKYDTGSVSFATPLGSGGLAIVIYESSYSSSPSQYFLSLLK